MRTNPFYDSWLFLSGQTGSQLAIGAWRYFFVAFFWILLIASIALAYWNWRQDRTQRTAAHIGTWLSRVAIGAMWYEGAMWKLPIPSGGFQYWLEEEAKYAAFDFQREFVTSVLLPNITVVNVVAILAEIGMAASFTVGFGVRLFALIGMAFAAQLYFGLYTDPKEWPWEFIFIVVICGLFLVYAAGRSLGLDALLRRRTGILTSDSVIARAYRSIS